MQYAVCYEAFDPTTRMRRTGYVVVEADGGDDAVSKGSIDIAAKVGAMGHRVIGVYPASDGLGLAVPPAVVEGDDAAPDEEPAPAVADTPDGVAAEKAELIAEAEMRGIAVDRRWGVARLREALG